MLEVKSYSTIKSSRMTYEKLSFNKSIRKTIIMETVSGWTFLSPTIVISATLTMIAIVYGFVLTFFRGSMSDLHYVGGMNWSNLFSPHMKLGIAFSNTFWYSSISVPTTMVLSLIITSLIRSNLIKNKKLWLMIFFFPTVSGGIGATIMFLKIFSKDGIDLGIATHPRNIMWLIILAGLWGAISSSLIGNNALFSIIDTSQYEAAKLDGATPYSIFSKITIPSLGPILAYSFMMSWAGSIGVFAGPFTLSYALGVPLEDVNTLMLAGYDQIRPIKANGFQNIGLGMVILFTTGSIMIGMAFLSNLVFPVGKKGR